MSYKKTWRHKNVQEPRFFIDGNHEYFPDLNLDASKPLALDNNLWHIPRGFVSGQVMFMGGGESIDRYSRVPGYTWFPEENITQTQLDRALAYQGKIDVVASHTMPNKAREKIIARGFLPHVVPTAFWNEIALDSIAEQFRPKLWVFAHWHSSIDVQIDDCRYVGLNIHARRQFDVPLGEPWTGMMLMNDERGNR